MFQLFEHKEPSILFDKFKAGNFQIEMEALLVSILVCKNIFKNNSVSKIVDQTIENDVLVRTDLNFYKVKKYENS